MDKVVDFSDDAPKKKKPGGTFASMGLSKPLVKAINYKGYKLATPIQRKCIPTIMEGRDVVAMARTGSGKSAAYLLPMIHRLKARLGNTQTRALIVSPTRELATQTFKFVREFSKYTNLTSNLVIGGESIGKDFETITMGPDILVATPGRLAHVLVEMKQKLNGVEVVVFDEADRLFEPGYKELEQVNEICLRLPESKQTLLFSATMPQRLADFAKVGLKNPLFVRLDVDSNLSETLKSVYIHCNMTEKFPILLHLLKNFIDKQQMTVVFMPTKHHIEYTKMLMDNSCIDCSHVYSSMDPEARKINIDKFTRKRCRVMLVTDIAARGIDIPLLDIVINFNFPFMPKLYIHRVGRVARAGRFGCAISLVSHDETPYLHALHVFFGQPMTTASQLDTKHESTNSLENMIDKTFGGVPRSIIDNESEIICRWHEHDDDLKSMQVVCENAMKPYLKTREPPAPSSVKAAKDIHLKQIGVHPLFQTSGDLESSREKADFLGRIKSYKPQATIFEVGHIKGCRKAPAFEVMQRKRKSHDKKREHSTSVINSGSVDQPELKKGFEDSKFYVKYQPDDIEKEKGLDIKASTMDLLADEGDQLKKQMTWDRKRKKYVRPADDKPKKIRTESGAYITSSYQSGLYENWKRQTKAEQRLPQDDNVKSIGVLRSKLKPSKSRRELKTSDEILKERNIREKREAILRIKTMHKAQRKTQKTNSGQTRDTASRRRSTSHGASSRGQSSCKTPSLAAQSRRRTSTRGRK